MHMTHRSLFLLTAICLGWLPFTACAAEAEVEERFPIDHSELDRSNTHTFSSYADVLEPAQNAVVSVTTARIVETMRGGRGGVNPMEEFLRRFYGLPEGPSGSDRPSGEREERIERRVPSGIGSGVIISADGYILTNNHVVSDDSGRAVDEIKVQLSDGSQVDAELVGRDRRTDIALIKIARKGLPFLNMADSEQLRVGDVVFAVGNPLGIGQTSTMGIVSAVGRTNLGILGSEGYENFIQTDAAINRGNSGGALIDAQGRLVGINTAIMSQTGGNIGIGFAIPITMARQVVMDLIDSGEVMRGYLGVSIRDLDSDFAEAFELPGTDGALVEVVQEGSPAANAGIRRGDVILRVDGRVIRSVSSLRLTVAGLRPGSEIDIDVHRDGELKTIPVVLGSLDDPVADLDAPTSPLEGVELKEVTPALRDEMDLREDRGILVASVDPRSPYASALSAGMVILEVNDEQIEDLSDLRAKLVSGRVNRLWVSFRGNRGYIALRMP